MGAWHLSPTKIVVREFRSEKEKAVVSVNETSVFIGNEEFTCDDRSAAEILVEEKIEELLDNGWRFVLIETMRSRNKIPMDGSLVSLRGEFTSLLTGRASVSILDRMWQAS